MVCYCGGLTASLVKQAAFDDRPPVSLMQSTLYNGGKQRSLTGRLANCNVVHLPRQL